MTGGTAIIAGYDIRTHLKEVQNSGQPMVVLPVDTLALFLT